MALDQSSRGSIVFRWHRDTPPPGHLTPPAPRHPLSVSAASGAEPERQKLHQKPVVHSGGDYVTKQERKGLLIAENSKRGLTGGTAVLSIMFGLEETRQGSKAAVMKSAWAVGREWTPRHTDVEQGVRDRGVEGKYAIHVQQRGGMSQLWGLGSVTHEMLEAMLSPSEWSSRDDLQYWGLSQEMESRMY